MTKTRKILGIILSAAIMITALIGIFAAGTVSAAEESQTFTLSNAYIGEWTGGVSAFSFIGNEVKIGLVYHYLNESAEVAFAIKNNSDTDYKIKSVSDTNNNSYVTLDTSGAVGTVVKANSETDVAVKLKYENELENQNERNQRFNADITFVFEKYTETEPVPSPKTGSKSTGYIIAAAVCALIAVSAVFSGKNGRKCIGMFALVLAVILVMPISADAAEEAGEGENITYTVNVSGTVTLSNKIAVTYDYYGDGTVTEVIIIDYLGKIKTPEGGDPTRDGYTFKGWYDYADNEPSFYSQLGYDITFTAKWEAVEYQITYNLDGGALDSGCSNPGTYKATDADITLNNPSKSGFYFVGWVEGNGTEAVHDVKISKGSFGNKTYTAKYAEYLPAKIRKYSESDNNVSYEYVADKKSYLITQAANSKGWGATGAVCDDSNLQTAWGQTYLLEFTAVLNNDVLLKIDVNCAISGVSDNDCYGDCLIYIDGTEYDGHSAGMSSGITLATGYHEIKVFIVNNSEKNNPNHSYFVGYTAFGLQTGTEDEAYEIRNIRAAVFD